MLLSNRVVLEAEPQGRLIELTPELDARALEFLDDLAHEVLSVAGAQSEFNAGIDDVAADVELPRC